MSQKQPEKDDTVNDSGTLTVQTGTGALLALWDPSKRISSSSRHSQSSLTNKDKKSLMIVLVITMALRLYDLHNPPNAVYEESVMGDYVNKYTRGSFFVDSEPPLAGLLYYFISRLAGYKGSTQFPGQNETFLGEPFPYFILRGFVALMGVASVAMTFLSLKLCGATRISAITGSCMVAFENSYYTMHRYVFPQPMLLLLVSIGFYCWKQFEQRTPFTTQWVLWGLNLGLVLGGAASARTAGGYMLVFVWIINVYQTWWTCIDLNVGAKKLLGHVVMRWLMFAILPLACYVASLYAHLSMTPNRGDGETFMPGDFQASLRGNRRPPVALNVSLGSLVTIRHTETYSFLHSHDYFYRTGSEQQQVTLYGYRDLNNVWMVDHVQNDGGSHHHLPPSTISTNQYVRLKHINTNRHLHSHKQSAPVSENDWQFEVSAYGADGYPGDLNDLWRVELIDTDKRRPQNGSQEDTPWQAIKSVVRFQHATTGCYLFSHPVRLPKWGFDQQEVTCATTPAFMSSLWTVETNYHPLYNSTFSSDYVTYDTPTLAEKLAYYTTAMNRARDRIQRSPFWQVPLLSLPLLVKGSSVFWENHRQVYIFGNLVVWYSVIGVVGLYFVFKMAIILTVQRGYRNKVVTMLPDIVHLDHHLGQTILAWIVHYGALFTVQSDAIVTDYLPALYFGILSFALAWDYAMKLIPRNNKLFESFISLCYLGCVLWVCFLYLPLGSGSQWGRSECRSLELNPEWDFHCENYLVNRAEYAAFDASNYGKSLYNKSIEVRKEVVSEDDPNYEDHTPTSTTEALLTSDEFRGIEEVKPQRLDLEDGRVRQLLIKYIKERGLSLLPSNDESPDEQEPLEVANPTYAKEVSSMISAQWARISEPPQLSHDDALAINLGLSSVVEIDDSDSAQ